MVFGINEIGSEIEEPFGRDPNDLPLDFICNSIARNVKDLLIFEPTHRFPFARMRTTKNYLFAFNSPLAHFFRERIVDIKEHLTFNNKF